MGSTGLTDDDHDRIDEYLAKPRYERGVDDLVPDRGDDADDGLDDADDD